MVQSMTAKFFSPTKVWKANLSMSAADWQSMQPRQGQGGGFGLGGGRFLGPNVETGLMPEAKLLPFLRRLIRQGVKC
jgi:hypothetical protein